MVMVVEVEVLWRRQQQHSHLLLDVERLGGRLAVVGACGERSGV